MSYSRRDPILNMVPILDLRPTQMTVGMIEVERKRKAWAAKREDAKDATLASHMVPVVLGPGGERYLTDHHHLARALLEEGQKEVYVTIIGDLRKAERSYFWNMMNYHGWTHPYDPKGRRCGYDELPHTVEGLEDDPYRSCRSATSTATHAANASSSAKFEPTARSKIAVADPSERAATPRSTPSAAMRSSPLRRTDRLM